MTPSFQIALSTLIELIALIKHRAPMPKFGSWYLDIRDYLGQLVQFGFRKIAPTIGGVSC